MTIMFNVVYDCKQDRPEKIQWSSTRHHSPAQVSVVPWALQIVTLVRNVLQPRVELSLRG